MTMKLAEALKVIQSAPPQAPTIQVALLCGFNPLHLEIFLRAELSRLFPDRLPVVKTGLYGDLIGNLQRIENVLAGIVAMEWADLDPRLGLRRLGGWDASQLSDILAEVNRSCDCLRNAVEECARKVPVVVSLPTLPLVPVAFNPPAQASELSLELDNRVASLAVDLSRVPGVRIVERRRLDKLSSGSRFDVNSDLATGFPYTIGHASALAELLARLVLNRPAKKGLITDLDDTLWRGILGDDGVDGISWDLEHHSQIHGLYQQLLRSLASSGTLIAVASKNEAAIVDEAFAARDPILPKADIFPFEVHWGPKSESVTRILRAWNIAADDVVCVDDSAAELAEIQRSHPRVECLLFPRDNPQAAYELFEKLRDWFGKDHISPEDRLRLASLRANAEFQGRLPRAAMSASGDFLAQIDGRLTVSTKKQPLDERALELVNKTNQFNLNGRRVLEADWRGWLSAPDSVLITASYHDKYGPLGKIAVIAGDLSYDNDSKRRKLRVRTWVMSCRAFSRQIEFECLRWPFTQLEVDELEFDFAATPRNAPIRDFLQKVLQGPPESECRLTREQFLQNCPASSYVVEEVA